MITLYNIQGQVAIKNPVKRSRVHGYNSKPRFKLLETLDIKLSNNRIITIPEGYEWDLSSTPRLLWWLLPPDGDFEIAALIHDYLYVTKMFSRKFADKEMLIWSKRTNSTNRLSLRNIDNHIRFVAVRAFGWLVWDNYITL